MLIQGKSYLTDPNKQFVTKGGAPNVNGIVRVFLAGTDDPAITYCDFNGTMNPQEIRLDNNGRAIIIADSSKSYRLEVRDASGGLQWTVEPLFCFAMGDNVVSRDDVFKLRMTRGGFSTEVYDPLQSPDTEVDINETELFSITRPGIYSEIVQSLDNGRIPTITVGVDGHIRRYYYTARDVQGGTMSFTNGHDGIVEILTLRSDGTYDIVRIPGEVSVLKGNCNSNSITPEAGGDHPEDWDCHELEKVGTDIWIGDDNRVHAKAGWYHVDMGVYVSIDNDQPEDARAAMFFGAYSGTVPDNEFDYTNYCATDFDLSYEHIVTPSVGIDIHVENDGDIIHLSASAPGEHTAECYLDWFSVHKITKISQGGGGGGGSGEGGDAAVFDLMDYADDLESSTLWLDMVNAMLDGKAVALKAPFEDDSVEAIGWAERSMRLKPGYTKEEYIEDILGELDDRLLALTFDLTLSLYGGTAKVIETIRVTPSGIAPDCLMILLAGYGAIVQGSRDGFASESIMPFNEAGDDFNLSRYGEVLSRLALKGIPITFTGYNITNECMFSMATVDKIGYPAVPSDVNHTAAFTMEIHGIATWEGEDVHNGDRFPCMYSVGYGFLPPEEDAEIDIHGKWEIESDNVRPLAIDSTYIPTER